MVTNQDLQYLYCEFNRKYFSNKLPKDMAVHFEKLPGDRLGVTRYHYHRPLYIEISISLQRSFSLTAMTLLHEMVHVSLPFTINHGPVFHKRMKKLARQGAFNRWW
jgi:hypothetical protein